MDDKQDVMAADNAAENTNFESASPIDEDAKAADAPDQVVEAESSSPEVSDTGADADAPPPTWEEAMIEEDDESEEAASQTAPEQPAAVGVDPAVVESMQREVDALKAQLDDRVAQYVRIAADFENFRKRTQKERENLEKQVKCSTLSELLPVVDNFERARSQIKPQTEAEMTIHKSYQSVYKQLVECMKRIGVSPMRAEGAEFDPSLHEAVMREPTNQYPEGTVIEELVRGYMMGDRVLRHAMVKVATEAEPDADLEDGSESEETSETSQQDE